MGKRPLPSNLPTPQELAQAFKRPRIEGDDAAAEKKDSESSLPFRPAAPPLAHSVPAGIMPIVPSPFTVADFFSDLPTDITDEAHRQMMKTVQMFPPPPPPRVPPQNRYDHGSMMVPFVYPPVPVLRPDKYLADQPQPRRRGRRSLAAPLDSSRLGVVDEDIIPVMPPLPFPPKNFMPYPLLADQSTLTPSEVFDVWLDALERLPRIDMVAASAAGSIFDIRAQAGAAGLTVSKLDEIVQNSKLESDPEADDDRSDTESSEALDSGYADYVDYASRVDTTNEYDPLAVAPKENTVEVHSPLRSEYLRVAPLQSINGATPERKPSKWREYSDCDVSSADLVLMKPPTSEKDVSNASGAQKERRRLELLLSFSLLEDHATENRENIYAHRKLQLLARLRLLEKSKIVFDDDKTHIEDDELEQFVAARQVQRDEELLRLKAYNTYEKIKSVLSFYQTSNRAYKNMNTTLVNKLEKLRHFFQFQKQLIDDVAMSPGDTDMLNIRSKESAKLYNSFIEQNYSGDIKAVFRDAAMREDGAHEPTTFDAAAFRKVYTERTHTANVHDFMPLVTKEEFLLITGEAPTKVGPKDANSKNKGPRHQIFQSSLYDRATSGSDTNASDSTASTAKKRPGRRAAPKPVYGEEASTLTSEAVLVAKIMKQFVGPAAANADELTHDLELIGVETRWPVK